MRMNCFVKFYDCAESLPDRDGGSLSPLDLTCVFDSAYGVAIGRSLVFADGPRGIAEGIMGPDLLELE